MTQMWLLRLLVPHFHFSPFFGGGGNVQWRASLATWQQHKLCYFLCCWFWWWRRGRTGAVAQHLFVWRRNEGEDGRGPCLALFYFWGRLLEDLLQEYSLFRWRRQTERRGSGRILKPLDDDTCVAALDLKGGSKGKLKMMIPKTGRLWRTGR